MPNWISSFVSYVCGVFRKRPPEERDPQKDPSTNPRDLELLKREMAQKIADSLNNKKTDEDG